MEKYIITEGQLSMLRSRYLILAEQLENAINSDKSGLALGFELGRIHRNIFLYCSEILDIQFENIFTEE